MILVAVVDDDPKDASSLISHIENYFSSNQIPFLIHPFRDGLDFIRSTENHDIVFMDIRMGSLDGLDTARFMRKINKDSILIFVTNMGQFAIKGYEVDALDFIIKPATMANITYVLDKAMRRLHDNSNTILPIRTSEGTVSLPANDILYVEVLDHNLIYHMSDGRIYTVRGRLSDIAKKLDERNFVMCNRSFIVNLRHVSSIASDTLTIGSTLISISKSHRKDLMQRFSSFLGDSL
ncbi:MAG: response regulator transcription factor [Clostridia bacterium]|nr:response regulator transcription factor [Clostridia bacterium]